MRKAAQGQSLHVAVWWILIYHITIYHHTSWYIMTSMILFEINLKPNGAANHVQTKATAARADIRMEKLTVSWTAMRLHVLYMTRVLEGHGSSTIEDWCGFIGCQWSHINVTGCGLLFSFLDLFCSRSSIRRLRKTNFWKLQQSITSEFVSLQKVTAPGWNPHLECSRLIYPGGLKKWIGIPEIRNPMRRSAGSSRLLRAVRPDAEMKGDHVSSLCF